MCGGEVGIKFFIVYVIFIFFIEQFLVVIVIFLGFIIEVEVKYVIKGGIFIGNIVMNSIKICLYINCVSDFIGIVIILLFCFFQNEWGVVKFEVVEDVVKQCFIGDQDF